MQPVDTSAPRASSKHWGAHVWKHTSNLTELKHRMLQPPSVH